MHTHTRKGGSYFIFKKTKNCIYSFFNVLSYEIFFLGGDGGGVKEWERVDIP